MDVKQLIQALLYYMDLLEDHSKRKSFDQEIEKKGVAMDYFKLIKQNATAFLKHNTDEKS